MIYIGRRQTKNWLKGETTLIIVLFFFRIFQKSHQNSQARYLPELPGGRFKPLPADNISSGAYKKNKKKLDLACYARHKDCDKFSMPKFAKCKNQVIYSVYQLTKFEAPSFNSFLDILIAKFRSDLK